jgi:uncharacterized protein (TIGR02996 family)
MRIGPPLRTEIVVSRGEERQVQPLEGDLLRFGRHPNNEVRVAYDYIVAPRHMRLLREPGGYVVDDLGTVNGTYMNGERIERAELRVGDVIRLGSATVYFRHTCSTTSVDAAHAPFLRAIMAAPDDPGPREVYADWLCERGDPRGEMILLQLSGRAGSAELLEAHEGSWVHFPIPVVSWQWRRGFIEEVVVDSDTDVDQARAILATLHPIRAVSRVK